jgi:starch phosphorylase
LYRKGYFYQRLDASGWQTEQPAEWVPEDFLNELPERATVAIEGRIVHLHAWRYELKGVAGGLVPVYLLDTDLPENTDWDRTLTDSLYGGDNYYRLCQEVILGIGVSEDAASARLSGHRAVSHERGPRQFANGGIARRARAVGRPQSIQPRGRRSGRGSASLPHTPVAAGHDRLPVKWRCEFWVGMS